MNWGLFGQLTWHGLSQAVITGGGIVIALNHWPNKWEWLVVGVSSTMAAVKGVDGHVRDAGVT